MNLGKQMLIDIRSCGYLRSNLFIMSKTTGESFVTNAKRDYSNSIAGTDAPSKVLRITANDQLVLLDWLKKKFER